MQGELKFLDKYSRNASSPKIPQIHIPTIGNGSIFFLTAELFKFLVPLLSVTRQKYQERNSKVFFHQSFLSFQFNCQVLLERNTKKKKYRGIFFLTAELFKLLLPLSNVTRKKYQENIPSARERVPHEESPALAMLAHGLVPLEELTKKKIP